MTTRYLGDEPCTSRAQVVHYLADNYQDGNEQPMPLETAQQLVKQGAQQIKRGISVFRSNVYYLGDEVVKTYGGGVWHEVPEDESEEDDDEY